MRSLAICFVYFPLKIRNRFNRIFILVTYCLPTYGEKWKLVYPAAQLFRRMKSIFPGRARATFSRNYLAQFSIFCSYFLLHGRKMFSYFVGKFAPWHVVIQCQLYSTLNHDNLYTLLTLNISPNRNVKMFFISCFPLIKSLIIPCYMIYQKKAIYKWYYLNSLPLQILANSLTDSLTYFVKDHYLLHNFVKHLT